jgi:hypothetical protein
MKASIVALVLITILIGPATSEACHDQLSRLYLVMWSEMTPVPNLPEVTCDDADTLAHNLEGFDIEKQLSQMHALVGGVKSDGRREGHKEGYAAGVKKALQAFTTAQAQDRANLVDLDAIDPVVIDQSYAGSPLNKYFPETGEQYNAGTRVRPNPQFTNPLAPGTMPHPSRAIICNTYGNQTSCY